MKKVILAIIAMAAAAASDPATAQGGLIGDLFKKPTQRHEAKQGPYYRMKADFTYKGDPVSFDIVIGCNALVTKDALNGRSFIAGIAPFAYGKEMKDGGALVAVSPDPCRSYPQVTESSPDFRPFMMTFPDAKAPWEGLGYATLDAYASPKSTLTFGGASLLPATKEEYEAWRATEAGKNIIKKEWLGQIVGRPFDREEWYPGRRYFPTQCSAAIVAEIAPERRSIVKWPEDRPEFWHDPTGSTSQALFGHIKRPRRTTTATNALNPFNGTLIPDPKLYPVWRPRNLNNIEELRDFYKEIDGEKIPVTGILKTNPENRGFAYCQETTGNSQLFSLKSKKAKFSNGYEYTIKPFPEFIHNGMYSYFQINDKGLKNLGGRTLESSYITYMNKKVITILNSPFLGLAGGL